MGADISFIEAPESRAEMEEIATRVKHPLFVNMLSGGVTPILSVKELEQLGYKIVVSPIESLMVCARAMCEEPSRSLSGSEHFQSDLERLKELSIRNNSGEAVGLR